MGRVEALPAVEATLLGGKGGIVGVDVHRGLVIGTVGRVRRGARATNAHECC